MKQPQSTKYLARVGQRIMNGNQSLKAIIAIERPMV
jgi:hypothetical protein